MQDALDIAASRLSHAVAADAVAALEPAASNRGLADHWLSLWQGDALPRRAALNPRMLKRLLPGTILFDVVPDKSVTVRLAGTGYTRVLGTELTGKDWVALAPQAHRALRLQFLSTVARGAIGMGRRRIAMDGDESCISEEILLPFAREPSGVHPVLVHVNFQPRHFLKIKSAAQATGDPLEFKSLPLTRPD